MRLNARFFQLVIALGYSANCAALIDCTMDRGTQTINFGNGLTESAISVARDAPIGTQVFSDYGYMDRVNIKCTGVGIRSGFYPNRNIAGWGGNNYSFDLGNGLSFRIIRYVGSQGYYESTESFDNSPAFDLTLGGKYELVVYKSGVLNTQKPVSAGYLGSSKWAALEYVRFNLTKPIMLSSASCQAPSVKVNMGDDYRLDEFIEGGGRARIINYKIKLEQCQGDINKVSYALKATSKVIDAKQGVVALNSSSTAKGIGLKLMNEEGQPIELDTNYQFGGFNSSEKEFGIPLAAAYYRIANDRLEAGTANAEVIFVVNYL